VIQRLLLLVSTICTLLVVASFVLFSLDEANAGSKAQQNALQSVDQPDPSAQVERSREQKHSRVREWVDDANDVLTKPFDGITTSSNIWVQRGVPALLAVLLYFVVLRILAGYAVKLRV
jgi:hypothetical protein